MVKNFQTHKPKDQPEGALRSACDYVAVRLYNHQKSMWGGAHPFC